MEEDKKLEYLKNLKEKIDSGKQKYSKQLGIRTKYNWLENKYNEFINNGE